MQSSLTSTPPSFGAWPGHVAANHCSVGPTSLITTWAGDDLANGH
jgi:hypothetical protein